MLKTPRVQIIRFLYTLSMDLIEVMCVTDPFAAQLSLTRDGCYSADVGLAQTHCLND